MSQDKEIKGDAQWSEDDKIEQERHVAERPCEHTQNGKDQIGNVKRAVFLKGEFIGKIALYRRRRLRHATILKGAFHDGYKPSENDKESCDDIQDKRIIHDHPPPLPKKARRITIMISNTAINTITIIKPNGNAPAIVPNVIMPTV